MSTRITIFVVGLLLILIFVAGVSVIGLTFINNNAQTITNRVIAHLPWAGVVSRASGSGWIFGSTTA
ncbi:hypothetical protein, partial [Lichenibacterium minor]|uniref:hypothetical protein n=1 Tax=Lichenibacterium minor TaxID=2316528 RepID=UPI001A9192AA